MFKITPAAASGLFQSIDSRLIPDPETLSLDDTPTRGLPNLQQTGTNLDAHLTGSLKSIEFDGVDDFIILPSDAGLGTEMLLEGIGTNVVKHGTTANNIAFDAWVKIDPSLTADSDNSEVFEVTIQRNSTSSTTGYDGIYAVRTVAGASAFDSLASSKQGSTSAYFLNFMFASSDTFSYSVTSACNIPFDTWTHIWCEHTVTGSDGNPFFTPQPKHVFKIYINGDLNKYQTGDDCMANARDTDPLPTTAIPLTFFGERNISFDGKLDEMRMWLNSGTTNSIKAIGGLGNIGLSPEDFNSQPNSDLVKRQFAPSGDYLAASWRLETLSATDLFADVKDSIIDSTAYNHHGTPNNFRASLDFSEERTLVQGAQIKSTSGEYSFFSLSGGSFDHGGLLVINDDQDELLVEEGIENLVSSGSVLWTPVGSGAAAIDPFNIFYGSSAFIINTTQAGDGALHTIDYSNLLFDKNDYTVSFRGLLTSGSSSARVTFTLGHAACSAATTAVFDNGDWSPIVIRKTVSADLNETSVTGSVKIEQLHNGGTDSGSLFAIDGLALQEGDYYSSFVGPDQIRKGGQLSWNTVN